MISAPSLAYLFAAIFFSAAHASAAVYNITFTSTDGVGTGGPTTGSITVSDADLAAKSLTPAISAFSAKTFTFSGAAASATYDSDGNLFSIGLSDDNGLHSLVLHGGASAPTPATWDLDSEQVPLQKDDFGTYTLTLAPEPSTALLAPAMIALTRPRRASKAR